MGSDKYEHSEDKANRLQGEAEAAVNIEAFFARNRAAFLALVQVYADQDADEALASLREKFWSALPAGSR